MIWVFLGFLVCVCVLLLAVGLAFWCLGFACWLVALLMLNDFRSFVLLR